MKLLIDMNLPPGWAAALLAAGYEAVHWITVGNPRAADSEIMMYAKDNGYVVLTHDLDFGAILAATGGQGPSVVQVRADDLRTDMVFGQVVAGLQMGAAALDLGALVTIDARRARIRLLPLQVTN